MQKFYSVILFILIVFSAPLLSEDNYCNKKLAYQYLETKGEVYFNFSVFNKADINNISKIVSIDNVKDFEVFAYANRDEFENFLKLNIPYFILKHPGDAEFDLKMSDDPGSILEWDYYPTYDAYIAMMNQFASSYPNLCAIVNIGQSVQGRQLLFARIKNNVNTPEGKPKFMFTSSMHGDETTGYVLMLRLINYLLTNYGTDPKITNMLTKGEIWINPLANPDGTYHGGNNTVNGAVRYNANNYDLNRNFPGVDGPNSQTTQVETQAMMNIAVQYNFSMSVNFHGGAEVVNYPWDSWVRLCTDDNWWQRVSRQYADTVHAHAVSGYMTDLMNGITNGYAWYYVHGSRQDYMIYYRHGREATIELSSVKLLNPLNLPAHWEYNYRSFLNYAEKVLYGINGTVTDSITTLPLKAKVYISGFDIDSSEVYSDSLFGKYYRLINAGNYNLTFSAPGYYNKTISNVHASNDSLTIQNAQLRPITTGITNNENTANEFKLFQNYPNPFNPNTKIKFEVPLSKGGESTLWCGGLSVNLKVFNILGHEVSTIFKEQLKPGTYEVEFDGSNYASGIYFYRLETNYFVESKKWF